jgi:hypothetical protein
MPVPPGSMRRKLTLEIAAPAEQSTARYYKSWQVHTSPRIARDYQNSLHVRIRKHTRRSNPRPRKSKYT